MSIQGPAHDPYVCNAIHEDSGARCFQETADHSVRHHAWAHYPAQLVTWPVEESGESVEPKDTPPPHRRLLRQRLPTENRGERGA